MIGRNFSVSSGMLHQQQQQRRYRSLGLARGEADGEEVPPNLARMSAGSVKSTRKGSDDLLSAADAGKHDYDWLLTPPGSPIHSSLDSMEVQQMSAALKPPRLSARSASATKTTRSSASTSNGGRISARTPAARSSSVSRAAIHTSRPSTPSAGTASRALSLNTSTSSVASSRPSTPKTRPSPLHTAQARPATVSRPSTPAKTRPATPSRPSTPTARPQLSSSIQRPSTPTRRNASSGAPRPTQKTVVPTDFSLTAPPNLRTKLPERPDSALRSVAENVARQQPVSPARPRLQSIANQKPAAAESSGFGRSLSKKSLDMALLHMDIRQGMGAARGPSLFPPSVKSTTPRSTRPEISSGQMAKAAPAPPPPSSRAFGRDIFESSRYDTILLKEDVRNMSWLHSDEDKSDQSLLFDLRLESLPEPFILSPVKDLKTLIR